MTMLSFVTHPAVTCIPVCHRLVPHLTACRRPIRTMGHMCLPDDRDGAYETYEQAIMSLNRLQSNASVIEVARRVRASDPSRNLTHTRHYLSLVGITEKQLRDLKAIHVTGTKGKGSTCAFTESILREYGVRTGMYSSPHLIEARERIRIDGRPISRSLFSSYFWQTYNCMESKSNESLEQGIPVHPPYFMFLTVMAVNVFVQEKVDAAIFEVGIGGEYDCTNFLKEPTVTGISSLGLDHVELLGSTIRQIAWQKAGIMKEKVPCFTVEQESDAVSVLKERSQEKACQLTVVPSFEAYQLSPSVDSETSTPSLRPLSPNVALGIPGQVQRSNASLAIQLSYAWLSRHSTAFQRSIKCRTDADAATVLPESFASGLASCRWPGRYQVLACKRKDLMEQKCESGTRSAGAGDDATSIHLFLDGAHTKESMNLCIDWFNNSSGHPSASSSVTSVNRVLLFNCTGYRNPIELLTPLLQAPAFHSVLFSPNKFMKDKKASSDQSNFTVDPESEERKAVQLKNTWRSLTAESNHQSHSRNPNDGSKEQNVHSFSCLSEAIHWIADTSPVNGQTHVLVTGSLHLVGGVLAIVDPDGRSFHSKA